MGDVCRSVFTAAAIVAGVGVVDCKCAAVLSFDPHVVGLFLIAVPGGIQGQLLLVRWQQQQCMHRRVQPAALSRP